MRRPSAAGRRKSQRHNSLVGLKEPEPEVLWDLFDRLLLPLVCAQAVSVLLSGVLNFLRISRVSAFGLFIWLALPTVAFLVFYHHLKVSAAGKAVLITGCNSAFARLLARKLDEYGFMVFAAFPRLSASSNDAAGTNAAQLLKDECSGRLRVLQLDVTSEVQMLEATLHIAEHLADGSSVLWAVIHCENFCALGELEWVPFAILRKAMDVNVLGAARLTQILLPLLRKSHGRVVFLSSALAKIPKPVKSTLCVTHAALESLATCLKEELRSRKVDVVTVAAGHKFLSTSQLTSEAVEEQARSMWKQLSDEQHSSYGEEYFEAAMQSCLEQVTQNADWTAALKSSLDATVRTFPLDRYTPVTRKEKLCLLASEYLPYQIYAWFYRT